jgi:hypothetical protein
MDIPVSERIVGALITQMIRSGMIPDDDVIAAADALEESGDEDAARVMRAMILYAHAPSQTDWEAERRRNRFHVHDGGKSDD